MGARILFGFFLGCTVATSSVAQFLSVKTNEVHLRKPVDQSSQQFPVINWISPSTEDARVAATDRMEVAFEFIAPTMVKSLTLHLAEQDEVISLDLPDFTGATIMRQVIPLQRHTTTVEVTAELSTGVMVRSRRVIRIGASEAVSDSSTVAAVNDSLKSVPFGYSEKMIDGAIRVAGIRQVGSNIIISYSLENNDPSRKFTVDLYSSRDQFRNPLKKVSGDVRKIVKPDGTGEITWNMVEEFSGDVGGVSMSFGLLAEVYRPFVTIHQKFGVLRTGSSEVVMWTFGGEVVPVVFAVLRNGTVVSEKTIAGEGTFLEIDKNFRSGVYKIRVSKADEPEKFAESSEFKVAGKGSARADKKVVENTGDGTKEPEAFRRKIPIVWKVVPVAVVAGIVFILLRPNEDPNNGRLPDPLLPK